MPLRIRFAPAEDLQVVGWNQTFKIVLHQIKSSLSKVFNSLLSEINGCVHLGQRHYWRGASHVPGRLGCYKIQQEQKHLKHYQQQQANILTSNKKINNSKSENNNNGNNNNGDNAPLVGDASVRV